MKNNSILSGKKWVFELTLKDWFQRNERIIDLLQALKWLRSRILIKNSLSWEKFVFLPPTEAQCWGPKLQNFKTKALTTQKRLKIKQKSW